MPNQAEARRSSSLRIVPYQPPGSSHKRRRVADETGNNASTKIRMACIRCREKKTRCSGHMPCVRCQEHGQTCHYMPTASPIAGENVRDSTASGNNASPLSPTMADPTTAMDPATPMTRAASLWPRDPSPRNEHTPEDTLQEDHYGHFHGGASEFAFLHFAKQKLASLPSMSIHFHDYPLAGSGKHIPVLPPKEVADQLVRNFFDFGLSTSRFVHEPTFIHQFEALYHRDAHSNLAQDDVAVVYMVMALGSHYSQISDSFCGYSASIRFFDMAHMQLQRESGKTNLASLQARLLEVHYLLNHSRMHEAWSSFGIIVRNAQALGLHRKSPNPQRNCITHEYRKRLFWAIYINDRILSSIFGRPCAIHDDDIDQEECSLANDDDISTSSIKLARSESFCSAAALISYARIAKILGKVLREFYSPSRRNRGISQLHENAKAFEVSLLEWQQGLPRYLDYTSLPVSAMSILTQRQMCTLKLTFAHCSLLLYRPFIIYSIETTSRRPSPIDEWIKHCHDKSIEAAKMVVAECQSLQERGLFSRAFWLVNYVQFASVGTLYMYSHLWPDARHARDIADTAMEQFPVGVEGDLVGQRYLQVLKELKEITSREANTCAAYMDFWEGDEIASMATLDGGTLDLGEPWSNLFFDTATFDEYLEGNE